MGEADKGAQRVRAMLKGDADDRQVYIALAQMNTRLRRFSDAEQALDKAEKLSTRQDDKEYVMFLRGSTFEREKRIPRRRSVPEGSGKRSPACFDPELPGLHAGRSEYEAGRGTRP